MSKGKNPRLRDIRNLLAHKLTMETVRAVIQVDASEDENEHAVAGIWGAYANFMREAFLIIDPNKEHAYDDDDPCLQDVVKAIEEQCVHLSSLAERIRERYEAHKPEDEEGMGRIMGEPMFGDEGAFNHFAVLKWFKDPKTEATPMLWNNISPEEQEEWKKKH